MNTDITAARMLNSLIIDSKLSAIDLPVNKISPQALHISVPLLQAILFEVCTYPKPGLVTPISTGSHNDMNIHSFIMSSAAIYPCFSLCAQLGLEHKQELGSLFSAIRPIGIEYEAHLLATTNGINTQRGALFLVSILSAAAGYLFSNNQTVTITNISQTVKEMCHGLCQNDFELLKHRQPITSGEKFYRDYSITGVRGEAETGFSTVVKVGLPHLQQAFSAGLSLRESFIHCLIALIATCDDTTVLSRSNMDTLRKLQQKAAKILALGGITNNNGLALVTELDQWCCDENISPGGSADLLSLTISIYLLCYQCFPKGIL